MIYSAYKKICQGISYNHHKTLFVKVICMKRTLHITMLLAYKGSLWAHHTMRGKEKYWWFSPEKAIRNMALAFPFLRHWVHPNNNRWVWYPRTTWVRKTTFKSLPEFFSSISFNASELFLPYIEVMIFSPLDWHWLIRQLYSLSKGLIFEKSFRIITISPFFTF